MRRAGRDRSSSGCRLAPAPAAHPEPRRAPFGQPGSWNSLCFPSFSCCIPLDVPGVAVRRDRDTSRGSPVPCSGDVTAAFQYLRESWPWIQEIFHGNSTGSSALSTSPSRRACCAPKVRSGAEDTGSVSKEGRSPPHS